MPTVDERTREAIIRQLLAIQTQCDAALALLGVESTTGSDIPQKCEHPPEKRVNHSVMGGPEDWECSVCGFHYKAPYLEVGD